MTTVITTRIVGGKPIGSTIEVSDSSAQLLISRGYAEATAEPAKALPHKVKATEIADPEGAIEGVAGSPRSLEE